MSDQGRQPRTERNEEYDAALKALHGHPAYQEMLAIDEVQRSLHWVFNPNWRELMALLDEAGDNISLAIELVQNVRPSNVQRTFTAEVTRRLHNHFASTASLVDHVRRLLRGRAGRVIDEINSKIRELASRPELKVVDDLRNYTLHRTLPLLGHQLSAVRRGDNGTFALSSKVQMDVQELLAWDRWSPESRRFLEEQGKAVDLRALIQTQGQLVLDLNVWIVDRLTAENEQGLQEADELRVAANAALAGVDIETARKFGDGNP